jgi:hypothetical protein
LSVLLGACRATVYELPPEVREAVDCAPGIEECERRPLTLDLDGDGIAEIAVRRAADCGERYFFFRRGDEGAWSEFSELCTFPNAKVKILDTRRTRYKDLVFTIHGRSQHFAFDPERGTYREPE